MDSDEIVESNEITDVASIANSSSLTHHRPAASEETLQLFKCCSCQQRHLQDRPTSPIEFPADPADNAISTGQLAKPRQESNVAMATTSHRRMVPPRKAKAHLAANIGRDSATGCNRTCQKHCGGVQCTRKLDTRRRVKCRFPECSRNKVVVNCCAGCFRMVCMEHCSVECFEDSTKHAWCIDCLPFEAAVESMRDGAQIQLAKGFPGILASKGAESG